MRHKHLAATIILSASFLVIFIQLPLAIAQRASDYNLFDPLIDIHHALVEGFVDAEKIDEAAIQRAMIDAMIGTLDDPHTQFIAESETPEFQKNLRGTYVGIGCEVNMIDDQLTIITPMDGSPALEAGVLAGDIVLEIEGESTHQMSIQDSIDRLMGEPNTPVTIRVRHLDETEEEIEIIRRRITTRTVKGLRRIVEDWNYCVDDELGLSYLRVTQFNESTIEELASALDDLQTKGMNGLVLDLRDDPGGALPVAVEVADLFLDEGMIVSVRPRRGNGHTFHARQLGTLPKFPMVVLVNGQSASASEIVAGALQENSRAKVLGTRTFGKGSVQEIRELDYDRGTLKFTTAHYYLPSGRNINRSSDSQVWGVDPDPGMVVPISDEDYVEMFRARREFEIIRHTSTDAPECVTAAWIREHLKDEQLAQAVEALHARLTGGAWPTASEDDATVTAFNQELQRTIDARHRITEQLERIDTRIAELQDLSVQAGTPPLLPPDIDLREGTLSIRDKHGNLVGTYRIESGDLEQALDFVQLRPISEE